MRRHWRWRWLLPTGLALLTGCAAGDMAAAPTPTATPTASQGCPAMPSPGSQPWPAVVPAALRIPTATVSSTKIVGAVTYTYYTTAEGLRAATLRLLDVLHTAGLAVGRGDAEATEADAPFVGSDLVGAARLTTAGACLTNWTLAVAPRTSSTPGVAPTLIPHSPVISPSALPFG